MKKPKKKKKVSRSKLVRELDKWFSLFIRLRYADKNGMVKCFTSGQVMHYKKAHCGHFISRRHYSTRWDEINCQVQSVAENIYNQGNAPVFSERLREKYGNDIVKTLLIKKENEFKASDFEIQVLINNYKKAVKILMARLNPKKLKQQTDVKEEEIDWTDIEEQEQRDFMQNS